MPAHRKFWIDREDLGEMVAGALYFARNDIGVVEATLIALAVASAPRVAFGVWEDAVHACRCPVGLAYPGQPTYWLEDRDEYQGFTAGFDVAAKRYAGFGVTSGVLEVR